MSYATLCRKWRPISFEDVKGQDHIVQTLRNQITSQRIGHAYLSCGTRGTGRASIAKIFARAVSYEHPIDGSPCNEHASCKNILSASPLSMMEIDAASNNGVENIRKIREQVQYPPTEGNYKVYIIDEVHILSMGAFNALLKTLEEPPSHVIFILATTEVHGISITVLSRCQKYDFKRITIGALADRLRELSLAEHMEVEDRALTYTAKTTGGSIRDALSLLDQCVAFHYGEKLTYGQALEVLGAIDTAVFSQPFRAVRGEKTKDCIYKLEELVIQGRELSQFVSDFIWYMRNLLVLETTEAAEDILDMSTDNRKMLEENAKLADEETLIRYIRVFSELPNQLQYAGQKRVLVELVLIKLTKLAMEHNLDSIIERLNRTEDQLEKGVSANPSMLEQVAAGTPVTPTAETVPVIPPRQVVLLKAQLEDLQLVCKEWGKIIRELGGVMRSSFRDTIVEPSGDSCPRVMFGSTDNYEIGKRPTTLGGLERYVESVYGKAIYFKTQLKGGGERMDTIYIMDEDLKENIHMDVTIEEEEEN